MGNDDQSSFKTTQQPATEILPDEALVSENPIPSTSYGTPQKQLIQQSPSVIPVLISPPSFAVPYQPTIQEAVTTRSNIAPSSSDHNNIQQAETNIDNAQVEITEFASVVSIVSPMAQIHTSNRSTLLKNKQHSEILISTLMKDVFAEKKKKRIEKESKTKMTKKNLGNCNKENCAKGKYNNKKCSKDKKVKHRLSKTKSQRVKKSKNKFI